MDSSISVRPRRVLLLALLVAWCSSVALAGGPGPTGNAAGKEQVLILVSGSYGMPARDRYVAELVGALNKGGLAIHDLHVEYLDLDDYPDGETRRQLATLLSRKYAGQDIQLVVCLLQPALNFLLNDLPDLAPKTPVLSWLAHPPANIGSVDRQFVFQSSALGYRATLERALELFPRTEQVIILQGNSVQERSRSETMGRDLAPWQGKLKIEDTRALSAAEIESRLAMTPKNTVIMGVGITQDAKGERFVPIEFIQRILTSANAPLFVLFDTNIGTGAVGGMVSRVGDEATALAKIGLAVLRRETQLVGQVTQVSGVPVPMFDWLQLQRWGADPAALPTNTMFINRPPSLWEQYKVTVVVTIIVLLALAALATMLLITNLRLSRARAEQTDAEERYRLLFESSMDGILLTVPDGRVLEANPAACEMLQRAESVLKDLGRNGVIDTFDPRVPAALEERNRTGRFRGELTFVRADGTTFPAEISTGTFTVGDGSLRTSIVIRDVTARKLAEDELKVSEASLREAQTVGRIGSYTFNIQQDQWSSSAVMDEIFGIGPDYPRTLESWTRIVHPTERKQMESYFREIVEQRRLFDREYRIVWANDGAERWVHGVGKVEYDANDQPIKMTGIIQDITDRKKSDERLHAFLENSAVIAWMKDAQGCYVFASDNFLNRFGFESDDVIGKSDSKLWPSDTAIEIQRRDTEVLATGVNSEVVDPVIEPGGRRSWWLKHKFLFIGSDGVRYVGGLGVDITKAKNAEEQLRKLSLAVEQSSESIVITDLNARIEYVNEAFVQRTGYSREEAIGTNPRILNSGSTPPETYVALWDALKEGRPWEGEFQNRRKDGSLYVEHAIINPIRQSDGTITHYVAVKEDVSEHRRLESALLQRQAELHALYGALQNAREEERHRLARELHDDLGQRVTALRMDLDWVESKLPPTTPLLPAKMANVNVQIDELTDSIRRLIEDMRPGMLDVLGLVAAVEDYVDKFVARTGIRCELATSPSEIVVDDKIGISVFRIVQEALNNVQKYARATHVSVQMQQSPDEIMLVITDNGVGLAETTEVLRKGFGVRGMKERVTTLNGRFSITSTPGKGVRIDVTIPT